MPKKSKSAAPTSISADQAAAATAGLNPDQIAIQANEHIAPGVPNSPWTAPTAPKVTGGMTAKNTQLTTVPDGPLVSSTPYRDYGQNLGNDLATLDKNVPAVPDLTYPMSAEGQDFDSLYDTRQQQLARRRNEELKQIGSEFDLESDSQEAKQTGEIASTSKNLAMMGGYLGGSVSETGALLNLEANHRQEARDLLVKRTAALRAARSAYEDKDFELAEKEMMAARDADNTLYTRQKDYLEYSLNVRNSQRQDLQTQLLVQAEQREKDKYQRGLDKEAVDFAMKNGVKAQYFSVDGRSVKSTNTGRTLTEKEFFAENPQFKGDWKNVPAGFIQAVEAPKYTQDTIFGDAVNGYFHVDPVSGTVTTVREGSGKTQFTTIGTDVLGNPVYGFVNTTNGSVIPANGQGGASGGGVTNFGQPTGGNIQGLPTYNTLSANPGMTRSNRNNNPGNIKVSGYSKDFPGVIGVESNSAADGGNFLVFDSPESGFAAMSRLLLEGKTYQGVNAETALRKYSGGGYGAKDMGLDPNSNFQAQIADPGARDALVKRMAAREGYKGGQTPANPTTPATTLGSNPKVDKKILDIIAKHPGEWGHAAAEIDQLGQQLSPPVQNLATQYDSVLKTTYLGPARAREKIQQLISDGNGNVDPAALNRAYLEFQRDNNYLDADTAAKIWGAVVANVKVYKAGEDDDRSSH